MQLSLLGVLLNFCFFIKISHSELSNCEEDEWNLPSLDQITTCYLDLEEFMNNVIQADSKILTIYYKVTYKCMIKLIGKKFRAMDCSFFHKISNPPQFYTFLNPSNLF